jgi:hypothetical protein
VTGIDLVVEALRQVAANPRTRGPLVCVLRADGELDVRMSPDAAPQSPASSFFCAARSALQDASAGAVGLVVPVRTLWGDEHPCSYLDAEALALVAVADCGAAVGLRCPMHLLPLGWVDAYEQLQAFAEPLRYALSAAA